MFHESRHLSLQTLFSWSHWIEPMQIKSLLSIFHRVGSSFVLYRVNFQTGAIMVDDKDEICLRLRDDRKK